ncbi:MAG: dienelactone hydrolase [Candidatus Thioglobus sp.]|nr:MAG: dienelactone hydrolase [Candidatus Thioglobus sp.]RUM82309.1 MAG: dienelactone hydrolase [Candidatus Thioglobus sp.]RUM84928.1 MAG: dienelactone hydrolase [Candidatus Thioglobus sp.]
MKRITQFFVLLLISTFVLAVPHPSKPWVEINYPQDKEKRWWDDAWWKEGQLPVPQNHKVSMESVTYMDGDVEVEAYLFKPTKPGKYLPVLFQHGRRGLDSWTLPRIKRLAARGFIVLAPDMFGTYMESNYPIEHKYIYDEHVAKGIDTLLQRTDILGDRACAVSHTRGGYMTLRALVKHKKQDQVACYVSYYPHWQDPNAAEAKQIYQYAPELNDLNVPTLVFIGEHDQYQRIRPIMAGIDTLKENNVDAELIIYPGIGRGFDFRPVHVRTFADDLATKDANQRTAAFIRQHLMQR